MGEGDGNVGRERLQDDFGVDCRVGGGGDARAEDVCVWEEGGIDWEVGFAVGVSGFGS